MLLLNQKIALRHLYPNFVPEDPITRVELVDFLRRTGEFLGSRLRGNPNLAEVEEPVGRASEDRWLSFFIGLAVAVV